MNWMGWRDFAGGEMTNWGAHGVDQIQWAIEADETGPVEVKPLTEGPHGHVSMLYANGVVVTFVLEKGPYGGGVFIGEKGKLEINRNKVTSNPPEIAAEILEAVDVSEEERQWSDQTALSGRPVSISRTGSTACVRGNVRSPTSRSVTVP